MWSGLCREKEGWKKWHVKIEKGFLLVNFFSYDSYVAFWKVTGKGTCANSHMATQKIQIYFVLKQKMMFRIKSQIFRSKEIS